MIQPPSPFLKTEWSFCEKARDRAEGDPNQDAMLIYRRGGTVLYAVFDGMGGHADGHRASSTAKALLQWLLDAGNPFNGRVLLDYIHSELKRLNGWKFMNLRMGTTAVIAVVEDGNITVWNVGDSPCFIFRRKEGGFEAEQLYFEHTMPAGMGPGMMFDGHYIPPLSGKKELTDALGVNRLGIPHDVKKAGYSPGDILVLMSDGVSESVGLSEMARVFARFPEDSEAAGKEIIRMAEGREPGRYRIDGQTLNSKVDDKTLIVRIL